MDAEDGLPLGDEEPGEVFTEVATLAVVGEGWTSEQCSSSWSLVVGSTS
jgi:hypothetical protein